MLTILSQPKLFKIVSTYIPGVLYELLPIVYDWPEQIFTFWFEYEANPELEFRLQEQKCYAVLSHLNIVEEVVVTSACSCTWSSDCCYVTKIIRIIAPSLLRYKSELLALTPNCKLFPTGTSKSTNNVFFSSLNRYCCIINYVWVGISKFQSYICAVPAYTSKETILEGE